MAAWKCEVSLLPSLMKYFSTLKEKFRISARLGNILYACYVHLLHAL